MEKRLQNLTNCRANVNIGQSFFYQRPSMVPHPDIDQAHCMQSHRNVEVILCSNAATVSRSTQRRRMIVNATAVGFQIDTPTPRLMSKHHSAGNERMWCSQVLFCCFASLKAYEVSLATQCATVARDLNCCWDSLHLNDREKDLLIAAGLLQCEVARSMAGRGLRWRAIGQRFLHGGKEPVVWCSFHDRCACSARY